MKTKFQAPPFQINSHQYTTLTSNSPKHHHPSKPLYTLLIDNYDSFTFNLYQYLAEVNGMEPLVIKNDSLSWEQLKDMIGHFDNVVISPGPGIPTNDKDFGVCKDVLLNANIPILGVCLGHQGIGALYGTKVVNAPQVAHGMVTRVRHFNTTLFKDIPPSFNVVRYHSWVVEDVSTELEVTAITEDEDERHNGLIMAIQHKTKPLYGVQFHPESISTEYGHKLLENFGEITRNYKNSTQHSQEKHFEYSKKDISFDSNYKRKTGQYSIVWEKLKKDETSITSEDAFLVLYQDQPHTFWLDSSRIEKNLSRFSFIGSLTGPLSCTLQYYVDNKKLIITTKDKAEVITIKDNYFDFLKGYMEKYYCCEEDLPFDFQCGLVGYFGYEMRKECGYDCSFDNTNIPQSEFMFVDRMVAFDHQEDEIYILSLTSKETLLDAKNWIKNVKSILSQNQTILKPHYDEQKHMKLSLQRDYYCYKNDINRCLDAIHDGDSYELCLTNKILTKNTLTNDQIIPAYLTLRKKNPAPFSALLRFKNFSVLSSSPEKFLTIDKHGVVESKPIKGTLPRGSTREQDEILKNKLKNSKKDFSENLMIVDLVRNDISHVCKVGTVKVPKMMVVESYASVHQLVSTVVGDLNEGASPLDCIKYSFPPGSMTGAPKKRSIEILHTLEKEPRGIYSGALGYISITNACNLSVVIRTAVVEPSGIYIGCGGAIVAASDPEEEFKEMKLKAMALLWSLTGIKDNLNIEGVPNIYSEKITYRNDEKGDYFELLETMLWKSENKSFFLLDKHMTRLKNAADHFKFPYDYDSIIYQLNDASSKWTQDMRVRLTLSKGSQIVVEGYKLLPLIPEGQDFTIKIACSPVESSNTFLKYKTTKRDIYNYFYQQRESANDMLLWNEKGNITETTIANIAILRNGQLITPPVSSGILPGTMREKLLEEGKLKEEDIKLHQLCESSEIYLFNSVRGMWKAKLIK